MCAQDQISHNHSSNNTLENNGKYVFPSPFYYIFCSIKTPSDNKWNTNISVNISTVYLGNIVHHEKDQTIICINLGMASSSLALNGSCGTIGTLLTWSNVEQPTHDIQNMILQGARQNYTNMTSCISLNHKSGYIWFSVFANWCHNRNDSSYHPRRFQEGGMMMGV